MSPTPSPPDPFAADAVWTQPWVDASRAMTNETLALWACACASWNAYLGRVAAAAGPAALFDAGAELLADNLEICLRAAAAPLQAAGLEAPLLNDA